MDSPYSIRFRAFLSGGCAGFAFLLVVWSSVLPFPLLALLLLAVGCLLVMALLRLDLRDHVRYRRGQQGLCPDCGYDLRASVNRCPECGRPISRPRHGCDEFDNPHPA